MPNPSRRILYRAGFLTFCLFPTLGLAGWIVNVRVIHGAASGSLEADARPLAEAELSRLLGLKVTLDRISYPPEGYTVLEGVTIADPETGARIAFIPVLEMARGVGLVVTATRPEIDAARWDSLWEVLHERVLRQRGAPMVPIDLTAQQAIIVSEEPHRSLTFNDVQARLEPGKASIEFRLAGVEAANPAKFLATRDPTAAPPITRWELHTGSAEFPCVLFVGFAPWLANLGDECVFQGSLWREQAAGGWRSEASGRLQHLDLERLVSDRFPQVLSGQAAVTLNRAEFLGGRLLAASGAVEAGPGTIGGDLLGEAIGQFGLQFTPQYGEAHQSLMRYQQLKLGFTIDNAGLSLRGGCDAEGTLLTLQNNPQARVLDQPAKTLTAVDLIRVLAPAGDLQVPASRETEALLRMLPLPEVDPREATAAPQARIRLRDE